MTKPRLRPLLLFLAACTFLMARGAHARFVISGAGPAGLTTALELIEAGVPTTEIIVFESRAREAYATRTRTIVLDADASEQLQHLEVALPGMPFAQVDIHQGTSRYRIANSGVAKEALIQNAFGRNFTHTLRISDLELALLNRYQALGGQIYFGVRTQWKAPQHGRVRYTRSDRPDEEQTAGFVIVAEGAKSATRAAFGIPLLPMPYGLNPKFVGIDFDIFPDAHPHLQKKGGGYLFFQESGRLEGYGFISDRGGSFGAYIPERSTETREQAVDRLRKMAVAAGFSVVARWGAPYDYTGSLLAAESVDIGPRLAQKAGAMGKIFLIGDAARTTDPISANGLNTALRDAAAVGVFVRDWRSAPRGAELGLIEALRRNSQRTLWGSRTFEDWVEWMGINGKIARVGFDVVHRLPSWEESPDAHWSTNWTRSALKRTTAVSVRYLLKKVRAPQPASSPAVPHSIHPLTCVRTLLSAAQPDPGSPQDPSRQ